MRCESVLCEHFVDHDKPLEQLLDTRLVGTLLSVERNAPDFVIVIVHMLVCADLMADSI